jgi:PQQ-like domain
MPDPSSGSATGASSASCLARNCRSKPSDGVVRWTTALPGQWIAKSGLDGTVPASGQAYGAVGDGIAAVGMGMTLYAYAAGSGTPLWTLQLSGFPADAGIVSVRAWPGEITAGIAYGNGGAALASQRREVVIGAATGVQVRDYAAAPFGGAVGVSTAATVIIGNSAVTSYVNKTGKVRWRVPTGPAPQAWRADGQYLYVTESAGGYLGSQPVTALRKIDLETGAEQIIKPFGPSFAGTLGAATDGVVLFTGVRGVTAYDGITGAQLWSIGGAVPESTDPSRRLVYLTKGSNLLGVDPWTGRIRASVSGSAAGGSGGVYSVRNGVALGLDQGSNGDAWGYDIAAQRVTWTVGGLPWPHYFVDLSGIGGSADASGSTAILAICKQLGNYAPASPSGSASPSFASSFPSTSATARPSASPTPAAPAGQPCQQPELVAINR